MIVSFGADFLGSWISPVQFTKQYVVNRNLASLEAKRMSRHIQFETGMSMTAILKHIGKRKRTRQEPKEKTDEEKSKERLGKLEAAAKE